MFLNQKEPHLVEVFPLGYFVSRYVVETLCKGSEMSCKSENADVNCEASLEDLGVVALHINYSPFRLF